MINQRAKGEGIFLINHNQVKFYVKENLVRGYDRKKEKRGKMSLDFAKDRELVSEDSFMRFSKYD